MILIALRADFFGRLAPYVELADLVGPEPRPARADEPRRAPSRDRGPGRANGARRSSLRSSTRSSTTSPARAGGLPLLSTALLDLWRERERRDADLRGLRADGRRSRRGRPPRGGGLPVARRGRSERLHAGSCSGSSRAATARPSTRRRATREELDADDDERVARVLAALVERRLLVADDGTVELVHEALLEQWPRLVDWLDEDAQGRRLHRHLTQAASEWEAAGRDPGELYRGARLAATLEWADAAGADAGLNRLERRVPGGEPHRVRSREPPAARPARGRRAAPRRGTRRRRGRAGGARLRKPPGDRGDRAAARRAGARRAAASTAPCCSRARGSSSTIRLRRGAISSLRSCEARRRSPCCTAAVRASSTTRSAPTVASLAVRSDNGSVAFFDTRTLREVGPRFTAPGQISYFGAIVRPVRALAFSPDGRTLAVGDSDGRHATLSLVDTRTHRARASLTSPARCGDGGRRVRTRRPHGRHRRGRLGTQFAAARGARLTPSRRRRRAPPVEADSRRTPDRVHRGRPFPARDERRDDVVPARRSNVRAGAHVPRLGRGGALSTRRHGRVRAATTVASGSSTCGPAQSGRWGAVRRGA